MAVLTRGARHGVRGLLPRPDLRPLLLVLLGAIALPLAITLAADVLYADRARPGVTVAGVEVGSLSRSEILARLEMSVSGLFAGGGVVATYDGHTWTVANEIVERHEHGYLVERYPTGLDAAVFLPGNDLKWRNDTAAPVFLWSWVGDTSVTFDVWSVPTGRTVAFSAPVQWSFVSVAKDQPADPAFPAGYEIRGRDVIRTRTVTENGSVLHQDT